MGAEAHGRLDVNQIPEHQYHIFRLLTEANAHFAHLQTYEESILRLHTLLLTAQNDPHKMADYENQFGFFVELYCRNYIALSECLRSAIEYSDQYAKNIFTAEESQFIWNVSAEIFKIAKDIWASPYTMKGFEKHHTAWQATLTKVETILKPHFNSVFERLKKRLVVHCKPFSQEIIDTRNDAYKKLGLALGPMFRDKRHFQYT